GGRLDRHDHGRRAGQRRRAGLRSARAAGGRRGNGPRGGVMGSRIPIYLSHSYRPEDRQINRYFWEVFWDAGFAFTVDPKSTDQLSTSHLELMMQRSAGFVAIAPYRADQEWYKTSPYIVFEHNMAVRAKKP